MLKVADWKNLQPSTFNLQHGSMFTGIIQETGTVEKIARGTKAIALTVRAKTSVRGLKIGGSLAVNGCCLTAAKISSRGKSKLVQFDLLAETWTWTNFQFL